MELMDVMIDIESLGSAPGSAILSIGAVEFDPQSNSLGREFYQAVNLASSVRAGLTMEPATVVWWMQQSEAARQAAFAGKCELRDVLNSLRIWRESWKGVRVWAHGATFDPVLLDVAYRSLGERQPWAYREVRDTRTLFALAPGYYEGVETGSREGVKHHALADAKEQAGWVQRAYRLLGLVV